MPSPATPIPVGPPIRSTLASDPEMGEIVVEFVAEMPSRAKALQDLWEQQQLDDLRRLAHQLKGASGGYGFATVGKAAGDLEQTLVRLGNGDAQTNLEQLRRDFQELVGIVKRVTN